MSRNYSYNCNISQNSQTVIRHCPKKDTPPVRTSHPKSAGFAQIKLLCSEKLAPFMEHVFFTMIPTPPSQHSYFILFYIPRLTQKTTLDTEEEKNSD